MTQQQRNLIMWFFIGAASAANFLPVSDAEDDHEPGLIGRVADLSSDMEYLRPAVARLTRKVAALEGEQPEGANG